MKTKKELNILKNDVETVNKKLAELTEQELTQVAGGVGTDRADIQKEIEQSISQIDEDALVTDNGKFLNNGNRSIE